MQGRAGQEHRVIGVQPGPFRQLGAVFGRLDHVAYGVALDGAQGVGIGLAAAAADVGPALGARVGGLALGDEKSHG